MRYCVLDAETNGLLKEVTKLHCICYRIYEGKNLLSSGVLTTKEQAIDFFKMNSSLTIVGHNIIKYDIPVLEKLLEVKIVNPLIDSLGISFYHFPVKKFKHGLAAWGERLGFGKPVVEDWKDQALEVYIHRCQSDVEINTRLFHFQMDYLMEIYDNDLDQVMRLVKYLNFKLDCLRDQESNGITLDIDLCKKSMEKLDLEIANKTQSLSRSMPQDLGKILFKKPKVCIKANGELSHYGQKWFDRLEEMGLPNDLEEIRELPNPGSPNQLKAWLDSLGWVPETFKLSKATEKMVPQVSLPHGAGLCPSVKRLSEVDPALEYLDGLYKAQHRYGLFKSFMENVDEDGYIYSEAHGFTNTLRMQHSKPIVNLPGVDKFYGKEIRGCLKVSDPEEYIMCGSDVSGLEDNTKQHYIYFFDPQYVKDMRVPGFDPHIDIGVLAGLITKEEEQFFKDFENINIPTEEEAGKYKGIKKVRGNAKTVNFSATYGAGPPKIAETLKCDLAFATKLHTTYWERNKAVKETAKSCVVKIVNGQKWLYNPVSKFWMFLKAEKDRFSTLNQSTGCYFFDSWLSRVRRDLKPHGVVVLMQYHDELMFICKKSQKSICENILRQAMKETNESLKLNIEITISVDWGKNYSETH